MSDRTFARITIGGNVTKDSLSETVKKMVDEEVIAYVEKFVQKPLPLVLVKEKQ